MQKKTKRIIILSILIILFAILLFLLIINKIDKISQTQQETAKAIVYTKIGEKEIDITGLVVNNPLPQISAGMIPIKKSGDNWIICENNDNWYNYNNGEPAYIMLNDGVYQSEPYYQMPKDKKLAEENIGTEISANDTDTLGSIYMYIPRFAYNLNDEKDALNIIENANIYGSYSVPEIFTYTLKKDTVEERKINLNGMWVEYTSLSGLSDVNNKISNMNQEDNTYGFIKTTIASKLTSYDEINRYINAVFNDENKVTLNDSLRTILFFLDKDNVNPIKASGSYNEETKDININIISSEKPIVKIVNQSGENVINYTEKSYYIGTHTYVIIDELGFQEQISVETTGYVPMYLGEIDSIGQYFRDLDINSGNYTVCVNGVNYDIELINVYNDITYTENTSLGDDTTDYKTLVVKYYGNVTVGSSATLTATAVNNLTYKKGMYLCVLGDLENNGTITMTARGTYNCEGQDVYLWKNEDNSYEYVPAVGGTGADSASLSPNNNYYNSISGNKGKSAEESEKPRGTGGGGSGSATTRYRYVVRSGKGGDGTSYSGGTGGGGASTREMNIQGNNGEKNGGKGGNGYRTGTGQATGAGGGAGNPGGNAAGIANGNSDRKGGDGTGGLLIIYANNIINNKNITSYGVSGGDAIGADVSYGGSSGGGSINIFTKNEVINNGTISAAGGSSRGSGGAGGTGSVTTTIVTN